jgi:hypothetical protein
MLEKLFSSSKTARSEFYSFLTQGSQEEEEDSEMSSVDDSFSDGSYDDVQQGVGRRLNQKKRNDIFSQRNTREKLLGMLMRVQHDILLFLTSSPTQKPIWWNVKTIYSLICSLFQNLCENNYLQFKIYLSQFTPKVIDDAWNSDNLSCMEIFTL